MTEAELIEIEARAIKLFKALHWASVHRRTSESEQYMVEAIARTAQVVQDVELLVHLIRQQNSREKSLERNSTGKGATS
jgi:hypothetical protein